MVYDPVLEGKRLIFGVSGALYNSAAVLYDRQTESLWAQPIRKAITGPLLGTSLSVVPSQRTRWSAWLKEHPDTLVLSIDTGYSRSYSVNPYLQYQSTDQIIFPVKRPKSNCKIPAKARVLGVEVEGKYRAYPLADLKKAGRIRDLLGTRTIDIVYEASSGTASAFYEDGSRSGGTVLYWFAWQAFHPESDCFRNRP